jgi:hypothetical protein
MKGNEMLDPSEVGEAVRVGGAVKFRREMVSADGGAAAAVGLEFLILDARGRIRADYRFLER